MQQVKNAEIRRELSLGHYNAGVESMQPERFIIVRTGIYAPPGDSSMEPWEFGVYGWVNIDNADE